MSTHQPSPIKVKICGLKDIELMRKVMNLGADYMGIIVDFPNSPRNLSLVEAKRLTASVQRQQPSMSKRIVGVFVNQPIQKILHLIQECSLTTVQLHGEESPEYCEQIQSKGVKVLKTFRVRPDKPLLQLIRKHIGSIDGILLDGYSSQSDGGGLGKTFDWTQAATIKKEYPLVPLFLAGGLESRNVQKAITTVRPYAVDVSSGVEKNPGVKDLEKIKHFITEARRTYEAN